MRGYAELVDATAPSLPIAAIEALPLGDRAAAYLAVHAELLHRLEAAATLP
jgi:hypothetical protein